MFGVYFIVVNYMKKVGAEMMEQINTAKQIKKEMDRQDKIHKEEIKRFLGVK